ncbi:MAG TPA: prepilin-type N-terminal cleavage/methylation domain-containing protein [Candidatus Methylomirabilis sp.]|nr:prepilin-type N-terminal cleavage/methylation domain-containing protein [Candidatus Methylomirabilis sp.]
MLSFWHKKMRNQRGFTLVELMIVVAIIGILTAIAFPLYANIQARARVAKAQADIRTLASAAVVYSAHTGSLPGSTDGLTSAVVINGVSAGPFVSPVPVPPLGGGWPTSYSYHDNGDGTFTISASGDGATVCQGSCTTTTP